MATGISTWAENVRQGQCCKMLTRRSECRLHYIDGALKVWCLFTEQLECVRREAESCMADKMKAERQCQEAQTKLSVLSGYFKEKELQLQRLVSYDTYLWNLGVWFFFNLLEFERLNLKRIIRPSGNYQRKTLPGKFCFHYMKFIFYFCGRVYRWLHVLVHIFMKIHYITWCCFSCGRELGEHEALRKQNLSKLDSADETTRSMHKELEMCKWVLNVNEKISVWEV